MDIEKSSMFIKCPNCGNVIHICKVWFPGGCNAYGSFVLKCNQCGNEFEIDIGRDVDESFVKAGAKLIERKYRD